MLRPPHHERRLVRHPVHPAPSLTATNPQPGAAALTADAPALKPEPAPPLTDAEKADLFRQFDSYVGLPGPSQ